MRSLSFCKQAVSFRVPSFHILTRAAIATALLCLCCFTSALLSAQRATGAIAGHTADATGAVLVGATIDIRNLGTSYVASAISASDGGYIFPNVPLGVYEIRVSAPGFKTSVRSNVQVSIESSITADFVLDLGDVSEQVTVTDDVLLVDTMTNNVSKVINEKTIAELPLNGRNPATLVNLSPGVGPQLGGSIQGLTTHPGSTIASSNGGRQGSTGFQLDGSSHMDAYMGSAQPFPNPEATQEFRVSNLNYSAEFGFSPGAVVNVATRSGSNQFHGSLFEFHRQKAFNARNFFAAEPDGLRRNQYGGSIGGPILKDKLFFFFSTQRTTEFSATAATTSTSRTPTPAMLSGDLSAIAVQLRHPVTGAPLPNNQLPASQIGSTALRFLEVMKIQPETSNAQGFLRIPGAERRPVDLQFTGRVDYNISNRQNLMVRFFHDDYLRPSYTSSSIFTTASGWSAVAKNYAIRHTFTATPSLVNVFDATINDTPTSADVAWPEVSYQDLGIRAEMHPNYAAGVYSFWGPFGWDSANNLVNRNMTSFSDSVYWISGRHSVKFGGVYRRGGFHIANNYLANGVFYFDGQTTGDVLADFLTGRAAQFVQNGSSDVNWKQNEFAAYIEDSFRVTPTLTINAGIRFEPWFPATTNKMHVFRPGQQSTVYPNAPTGLLYGQDAGVGEGGTDSYHKNWLPRLGVAWAPRFLPRTSIRAAVGVFSSTLIYSNLNAIGNQAPFSSSYTAFNPADMSDPWAGFPGGNPYPEHFAYSDKAPPSTATFSPMLTIAPSFGQNFQPPRVVSWNLSIERQVGQNLLARASYVGSQSSHLGYVQELNPAYYNDSIAALPVNERRLNYPQYASVQQYQSGMNASYNALQTALERRFAGGFTFNVNYTWSKSLDSYSAASFMRVAANPFNMRWNRGYADHDLTHMFTSSAVWEIPGIGSGSKAAQLLTNGWQISGLFSAYSGAALSAMAGQDRSRTALNGDRADIVAGADPSLSSGRSRAEMIQRYFDTSAFSLPALGTFGTSGRGIVRGPGSKNIDLGLSKTFTFHEAYRLQLRWEAFNAFNSVNLGNPNMSVSSVAFGRITSAGQPRIMQIAARFSF